MDRRKQGKEQYFKELPRATVFHWFYSVERCLNKLQTANHSTKISSQQQLHDVKFFKIAQATDTRDLLVFYLFSLTSSTLDHSATAPPKMLSFLNILY